MSGLESLAALGLTCNVLQLVGTVRKVASLAKKVYSTGVPYENLQHDAAHLLDLSQALQGAMPPTGPLAESQTHLRDVAASCTASAKTLHDELQKLALLRGPKALIIAKGVWRKMKLDGLMEDMERAQKIMDTAVLGYVCSTQQAQAILEGHQFSGLDETLRRFVELYSAGCQNTEELIKNESTSIKEHIDVSLSEKHQDTITRLQNIDSRQENRGKDIQSDIRDAHTSTRALVLRETAQLRELQTSQVQTERAEHQSDAFKEQILGSLRFEEMNQRINRLSGAHEKTFEWIFRSKNDTEGRSIDSSNTGDGSRLNDKLHDDDDGSDQPFDSDQSSVDLEYPFVDWLTSESPLYWISGKVGSGKSTLMKYILEQVDSRSTMVSQMPDTLIVRHFLWNSGTALQNNLQGLLSSLLYQLLKSMTSDQVCNFFMQRQSKKMHWSEKRSHYDWSRRELKELVLDAMRQRQTPVILFIDGLDEVNERDGIHDLLQLVFELSKSGKVCVSSRAEPELQRRLGAYPNLRMQDLTKGDIRKYCLDILKLCADRLPSEYASREDQDCRLAEVAALIVDRSEGVFLWACLVLKRLQSMDPSDSWDDLMRRIEDLPQELNKLYSEMWKRLNEDEPLYRVDAANYLGLYLAMTQIAPAPDLFRFMLALNERFQQALLLDEGAVPVTGEDIRPECLVLRERILRRCAGLLELRPRKDGGKDDTAQNPEWTNVLEFRHEAIIIIHRSAMEFLTGTPAGKDILQHATITKDTLIIHCAKADLCTRQIWPWWGYDPSIKPAYITPDWKMLSMLLTLDSTLRFTRIPLERVLELLCIVQRLCMDHTYTHHLKGKARILTQDFLATAVYYRDLHDIIYHIIDERNVMLTAEHRVWLIIKLVNQDIYWKRIESETRRMVMGKETVEINRRHHHVWEWCGGSRSTEIWPTVSILNVVLEITSAHIYWGKHTPQRVASRRQRIIRVIELLLDGGADLDQHELLYLITPREKHLPLWVGSRHIWAHRPWRPYHEFAMGRPCNSGLILYANQAVHLRLLAFLMEKWFPGPNLRKLSSRLQRTPLDLGIIAVMAKEQAGNPDSFVLPSDTGPSGSPGLTTFVPRDAGDLRELECRISHIIDNGLIDPELGNLWADIGEMSSQGKFRAIDPALVKQDLHERGFILTIDEMMQKYGHNWEGSVAFYQACQDMLQDVKGKPKGSERFGGYG